jgi:hypothetical protein
MCSVCYGIGNCPVCEPPDEQYYNDLENFKADEADKWNDEQKLNQQTDDQ